MGTLFLAVQKYKRPSTYNWQLKCYVCWWWGLVSGTQSFTCGFCADSILESEKIVDHSVGVWKIRKLVGGVRKYHRLYKKRVR